MATRLDTDFLTISEAAQLLKVSPVTVHRWIKGGRLYAYRVGPRKVRIRHSDLLTLFAPARPEEVMPSKESIRVSAGFTIQPLTDTEVKQGLSALQNARALGERMLARTGGQRLESSAPIIRQAREARARRLGDL